MRREGFDGSRRRGTALDNFGEEGWRNDVCCVDGGLEEVRRGKGVLRDVIVVMRQVVLEGDFAACRIRHVNEKVGREGERRTNPNSCRRGGAPS